MHQCQEIITIVLRYVTVVWCQNHKLKVGSCYAECNNIVKRLVYQIIRYRCNLVTIRQLNQRLVFRKSHQFRCRWFKKLAIMMCSQQC